MIAKLSFLLTVAAVSANIRFHINDGSSYNQGSSSHISTPLPQRPQLARSIPAPSPQIFPARQPTFTFPAPARQPVFTLPTPQTFSLPAHRPTFIMPSVPQSHCDPIGKPLVDEIYNGRAYHFSWCHDGGRRYTWFDASHYCTNLGNGFQAVSIEDQSENNFIANILATQNIQHIWTSGNRLGSYYWSWASNSNTGYTNWSHTGRLGVPQPDNDEQNEQCLAILNNHYNDGIKWHDFNCDHLKFVICEARQFYGV